MNKNIVIVGTSFLTGIFITMPILTISIAGKLISIFGIFFSLFYVFSFWLAVKSRKGILLSPTAKALALWFFVALMATLFGLIYFSTLDIWVDSLLSYLPKIVIYLTLLLFLLKANDPEVLLLPFLKGFILGCVLNLVWATAEGLDFYIFGKALNDIVFADFAKTLPEGRQYMTIIAGGIIRASGFNYDPAHLGGIIPIVVMYSLLKKKYFLLALASVSLLFSASTTALISSILAIMISMSKINFNKKIIYALIVAIPLVLFAISFGALNGKMSGGINKSAEGFYDRVSENYVANYNQGPRYIYHAYFPDAVLFNGFRILTGTGFGTASYPYVANPIIAPILDQEFSPYDPESTYISYLFDTGIFGLIIYLFVLLNCFLFFRRKIRNKDAEIIVYASLCAIILSGIFYHYTLTAYQVLLLISAVVINAQAVSIRKTLH